MHTNRLDLIFHVNIHRTIPIPVSMALEEPPASVDLAPYTGCPHCSEEEKFPGPLLFEAAPEKNPDEFDWNKYYWGTDWQPEQPAERKTTKCPLPHSITDRIPLEVYEHIIHFLRGHQESLYFCTLVHRSWYHLAQQLLYFRPKISKQAHFNAVVRKSCSFSTSTRALHLNGREPSTKTLPMVASKRLVHQLQCLSFYIFKVPYHCNFTRFMSRFSQLSHLDLHVFTLYSCGDLCRIICALPSLLYLELFRGNTVSQSIPHHNGPTITSRNHPHLRKLSLSLLNKRIMAPFSQWITSTDVFSTCTELGIWIGSEDWAMCIRPILERIGCTLKSFECRYHGGFSNIGTSFSVFWIFC